MTTELFEGIDLDQLSHEFPTPVKIPPTVPGRICHIDADFLAYQVSADDEKALSEMKNNCDMIIEKMRLMSGAEEIVLHLTPKGSDKGGRFDVAIQKEYQGNRKDKPKPKFLHVMREWMHKERDATLWMECEADDGMSIAQYTAIAEGNRELSVIATKDKDLTMVPGLQLDWDTGEITDTLDDFGYIILDEGNPNAKNPTKKIKGRGWKFFWSQMLTGDTADNIQGIPKIWTPEYLTNKPKACGAVMAYNILAPVENNKQAFELVRDLYRDCGKGQGFVHWSTGEEIPYGKVFQSEAQLLWMRRKEDINDALHWMQEHCL